MTTRRRVGHLVAMLVLALATVSLGAGPGHAAARGKLDCKSLEDCYSYDEMDEFLELSWGLVRDFSVATYGPRVFDVRLRYVSHGESGDDGCHGEYGTSKYNDMSYAYCPADKTIYIGQDQLWQFYSDVGDAAAVVGLAHEYGHALQDAQGVPAPQSPAQSVRHENQADCVAGAWFGYADELGRVEYPNDRVDLTELLELIGSSEADPDRDHGTTAERERSLLLGLAEGIDACNGFALATPLHTGQDDEEWRGLVQQLRKANPWMRGLGNSGAGFLPEERDRPDGT